MSKNELVKVPNLLPHFFKDVWPVDTICFAQQTGGKDLGWYEAKVISTRNAGKPDVHFKVHFQGWNRHYDDWVPAKQLIDFDAAFEHAVKHGTAKRSKKARKRPPLVLTIDPTIGVKKLEATLAGKRKVGKTSPTTVKSKRNKNMQGKAQGGGKDAAQESDSEEQMESDISATTTRLEVKFPKHLKKQVRCSSCVEFKSCSSSAGIG